MRQYAVKAYEVNSASKCLSLRHNPRPILTADKIQGLTLAVILRIAVAHLLEDKNISMILKRSNAPR